MPLYAASGTSANVTVVDGLTFVGAQAADGGYNVFQVNGLTNVGDRHACGATNVVVTTTDQTARQHPCGARFVSVSPFKLGTMPVTVTGGVFV